jgi:RND family efflux transporter MFP subunit
MRNSRLSSFVLVAVVAAALGALAAWVALRGVPFAAPAPEPAAGHIMPPPASGPLPAVAPAPAEPIEVSIPPDALERMRLGFAQVQTESVRTEVRVPGTVQPNVYKEVRVTPLVGGTVTQVMAEIGQAVQRGQPLAQIFSQELATAQAMLHSAEAEFTAEHNKLLRVQELLKLGAASREELEAVQASHDVHATHIEEARQRLRYFGLTEEQVNQVAAGRTVSSTLSIPAPIDGVILSRSVNPGQVVAAGQEMFTVTDLTAVWVEGNLLEDDFARVRLGSQATITAPAYPGQIYRGSVEYIDPRVDPQTRTAKVRVAVSNPGGTLRLGMYMDMLFRTGVASVPVVPKEAVQMIGPNSVVYVPVEGQEGRFRERMIRTGEASATGYQVLEGVKPGETVVTEGSFLLRSEALRQRPR